MYATLHDRMKRELGALCQELSRTQPLVLFIEDLHWADVSTVDMLNYLAGRLGTMRMLVLETHRPSDMAVASNPFLAVRGDLQLRGLIEEIALQFLDCKDVERYLQLQFPRHQFPTEFAPMMEAFEAVMERFSDDERDRFFYVNANRCYRPAP